MSQHTRHRLATRLATGAAAIAMPALALASALPAQAAGPSFTKIQGAAAHAAGLQGTVDAYRTLLGPDNGSTPGSQPSGHREINWDGVPDTLSAPALMPRNLFNAVVPRGAVFSSTAGNTFQVSADSSNPAGSPVRYGNINAQYPSIFGTSSPEKLFTPLGTTTTRVRFFVPGSNTRAYVKGFGAVFTDVDSPDSTKIELYDQWGTRLWGGNIPKGPTANKSPSFLGVKSTAKIYEVRIKSGNAPLSPANYDGGAKDIVVMDDLLYSEPRT